MASSIGSMIASSSSAGAASRQDAAMNNSG
jgi:hypothetical protein